MDKDYPNGDKTDNQTVYGYSIGDTTARILKECGDDLTRETVMRQAANLHDVQLPMLIPASRLTPTPRNSN